MVVPDDGVTRTPWRKIGEDATGEAAAGRGKRQTPEE
jgi:hypothetical protein